MACRSSDCVSTAYEEVVELMLGNGLNHRFGCLRCRVVRRFNRPGTWNYLGTESREI
jgi:hypothetical protein